MTRFVLRGLFYVLLVLAAHSALIHGIDGVNEYARITRGQAIVDTAISRGWIAPTAYKPTIKVTSGRVPPK